MSLVRPPKLDEEMLYTRVPPPPLHVQYSSIPLLFTTSAGTHSRYQTDEQRLMGRLHLLLRCRVTAHPGHMARHYPGLLLSLEMWPLSWARFLRCTCNFKGVREARPFQNLTTTVLFTVFHTLCSSISGLSLYYSGVSGAFARKCGPCTPTTSYIMYIYTSIRVYNLLTRIRVVDLSLQSSRATGSRVVGLNDGASHLGPGNLLARFCKHKCVLDQVFVNTNSISTTGQQLL